jgi:hypothetical protein
VGGGTWANRGARAGVTEIVDRRHRAVMLAGAAGPASPSERPLEGGLLGADDDILDHSAAGEIREVNDCFHLIRPADDDGAALVQEVLGADHRPFDTKSW